MSDSRSQSESTPAKPSGFQFGLIDILLVMTVVAVTLAVARAWEIGGGLSLGLLVAASLAVIRRRTANRILFLLLVVGSFSVGTWMAWRMRTGTAGYVSATEVPNVCYHISDKSYFDAFSCVLFTGNLYRVTTRDRVLVLPDRNVDFPDGADVAIVNNANEVRFVTIPNHCFIREPSSGGLYMMGIPYPSFRSERTFKTSFDDKALENTAVWQDDIVPFLKDE